MPYDPLRHGRRSIRLKGYDYAQEGAYYVPNAAHGGIWPGKKPIGLFPVTICTRQRECLFGEVVGGEMVLNSHGEIVWDCWQETPDHFPNVELDAFVVMPNHVHAVFVIVGDAPVVGATHASPLPRGPTGPSHASPPWGPTGPSHASPPRGPHRTIRPRGPQPRSLGAIVGSFKSAVTKRVNRLRRTPGARVWQRGFYDGKSLQLFLCSSRSELRELHTTRNDDELNCVRAYIANNPVCWDEDRLNPFRLTLAADQGPYPWEQH